MIWLDFGTKVSSCNWFAVALNEDHRLSMFLWRLPQMPCLSQPFPPIRDLSQRMSGFYTDTILFPLFSSVSEHVIIERQSESTIMFVEGSKDSYLGYMTLKFSPGMSF